MAIFLVSCCVSVRHDVRHAFQQWREVVVPEDPSRVVLVDRGYISIPRDPRDEWKRMEEYIMEKLVGGVGLRRSIEKLRVYYPEYWIEVPQPRLLRIECLGSRGRDGRGRVVEAPFGSEEDLMRHDEQLRRRIGKLREEMEQLGRHIGSGRSVPEDRVAHDAWGLPLLWERRGDSVVVRSAGVDNDWGTQDDIAVTVGPK